MVERSDNSTRKKYDGREQHRSGRSHYRQELQARQQEREENLHASLSDPDLLQDLPEVAVPALVRRLAAVDPVVTAAYILSAANGLVAWYRPSGRASATTIAEIW